MLGEGPAVESASELSLDLVDSVAPPEPLPVGGEAGGRGDYHGGQLAVGFVAGEAAASLAIQAGANIKALQNMLGHESAGLTLDRYGHLYGSDVAAVGVAINELLTRKWAKMCPRETMTSEVSVA